MAIQRGGRATLDDLGPSQTSGHVEGSGTNQHIRHDLDCLWVMEIYLTGYLLGAAGVGAADWEGQERTLWGHRGSIS